MTIIKRGNKYGAKVWDRADKKYVWLGTFPSEQEAIEAEKEATVLSGDETPTVSQWGRIWLSDYPRPAASSQRTYRYAVDQIVKGIGQRKLSDIRRREARSLAKDWPRGTSRVARTMWGDAVRDEVIEQNPWTNLRLETPRGRKDIDALTEAEILELAQIAHDTQADYGKEARAIILVIAYTGMRPGELCSIRRKDVDLERGEVTVRYTRDISGEKVPKNKLGRRIVLRAKAVEAIRALDTLPGKYLLHSKRGKPLNKGNLSYLWREVRAAWVAKGGKPIDLYELRHAAATMLIEKGLSAGDVAFQLGHQDGGRLVQSTYGHPAESAMRDRIKMADATVAPLERSRRAV